MKKKIIASVLAVVFAFSMAGPVGAITDAEYQVLVNQLAQLTASYNILLAQTSGGTTPAATGLCLSSDLSLGMTSAEVKMLQQGLNQDTGTRVAISGAGASGYETSYFGALTKKAVINFQQKYASEVLASWGLTTGTGYAGSTTRAKFNALYCSPAPVTPVTSYPAGCISAAGFSTTTGLSCSASVPTLPEGCTSTAGFSTTTGDPCSGVVSYPAGCTSAVGFSPTTGLSCSGTTTPAVATEGTFSASAAAVYTESSLKWDASNQTIYSFKVEAKNSDITLKRIFVKLTADSGLIPWKDLSYISLYDGDAAVKGVEVVSANLVENTYAKDYDVYFDGLNITVPKDGEKTFTIKATVPSYPENKEAFTIALPINGVRSVDTLELNQYNSSAVAGKVVDYDLTRTSGSLQIKNNSTTPQQGAILGSKTAVTKDASIFKFDVKAVDNDVTLKGAAISLTQDNTALLSAVYLFDGGNRLASIAPTATTATQTITFPDLTVGIAKDATKTFTVKVDLAKVDGSTIAEGETISAISTAATTTFSAIDVNDNNVTNITGSAAGYTQTVYTAAPIFALVGTPILAQDPNTSTQAIATFKISVTGYGDTIYMSSTTSAFTLTSSSGTIATVGTPDITASKALTADAYYEIGSGETVTFDVAAAVSKDTGSGLAYVYLGDIEWGQASGSVALSTPTDLTTYKTNSVNFY